jgi:hypothetical protein
VCDFTNADEENKAQPLRGCIAILSLGCEHPAIAVTTGLR